MGDKVLAGPDGAEVMVSACGALTTLTLHGYLKVDRTECPKEAD